VDQVVEARDQLNECDSARQQLLRIVAHHTVFIAERIDLVSKTVHKDQLLANFQSLWPVPERLKINALCSPKVPVRGTPTLKYQNSPSSNLGLERRVKRRAKGPELFYAQLKPKKAPRQDKPREESGSRALSLGCNIERVGFEDYKRAPAPYGDYWPLGGGDTSAMNMLADNKTPDATQTLDS